MPGRCPSALFGAVTLAVALAPAALAGAAVPSADDRAAAQARAEHLRIVDFWTPERMRAAIPRDFVRQSDGSFRLAATPKAKPGGSTGTPTVVPSTSGASWTKGGEVLNRTGKVFFSLGSANYQCSGSVADDGTRGGRSLVLTAGHCVFDNAAQSWATNFVFIPAYDTSPVASFGCSTQATGSLGCWAASTLVAHSGFTKETSYSTAATRHDFAFAVVGPGGKESTSLDGQVGAYPLDFSGAARAHVSAFGYPAAGKYKGTELTHCAGSPSRDPLNGYAGTDDPWGLSCTMTGGSSGGPWLISETRDDGSTSTLDALGNGGTLFSLNSYGYSGVRSMFGPVFDSKAQTLWQGAVGAANNGTGQSAATLTVG